MSEEILYRWGHASTCGRRPSNEDAHIIFNTTKPDIFTFVGIYDGHGGDSASRYAAQNLHHIIYQQKEFPNDLKTALEKTFNIVDKNYIKHEGSSDIYNSAGTTACVGLLYKDKITFANAGDSRAVAGIGTLQNFQKPYTQLSISHIAKQMTEDHKPHLTAEKERIEKYGSCVIQTEDDCSRVAGMLAVSRAIGDAPFKGCGVIAQPDVTSISQAEADFIIVACDGLWDVLSSGEAAFIVNVILAAARGIELKVEDARLKRLEEAIRGFLTSQNPEDEAELKAEREISALSGIQDPNALVGGSNDLPPAEGGYEGRFYPGNIARILAKTAVALGSEDNVSVIVGVKTELYA